MAQALVVVCDVCGSPAVETVSLKVSARSYQKDVCQKHLDEMVQGARAPRRGRPRSKPAQVAGTAKRSAAKRSTSAKRKSSAKRTAAKRTARKKAS
jgi:hypothetical protein